MGFCDGPVTEFKVILIALFSALYVDSIGVYTFLLKHVIYLNAAAVLLLLFLKVNNLLKAS